MKILQVMLLGICFNLIAVSVIGENFRLLVGRRFRGVLQRHAHRPATGGLWGMMLAMVTGKPSIVTHIMASLVALGAVGLPVALATVLWAEVGGVSIYFLFALEVTDWILMAAAVAGILYAIGRPRAPRPLFGVVFGIGFLLYSVRLLKGAAADLSQMDWFPALVANGEGSLGLTMLTSIVLTVVSQSPIGINMVTLALLEGGTLTFLHATLISCGIGIGISISRLKYWTSFRGRSRSLLVLPIVLRVSVALAFALVLLSSGRSAWVVSWIETLTTSATSQYLLFILLFTASTAVAGALFSRLLIATLAPMIERASDDEVFVLRFTNQLREDEPEAATELLESETAQLLGRMPVFLEMIRQPGRGHSLADAEDLHRQYRRAEAAVEEFCEYVLGFGAEDSSRFVRAIEMQRLLDQFEESLAGMTRVSLSTEPVSAPFETLRNTLVESVDFMLGTTIDCFADADQYDRDIFELVTRDKAPLIAEMREAYLEDTENLTQAEKAALLALLIHFEALVNHMRQLGLRRAAAMRSAE